MAAILVGGYALTLRAHVNFLDQELREARAQSASAQLQLKLPRRSSPSRSGKCSVSI
jgi:hypothetical protein